MENIDEIESKEKKSASTAVSQIDNDALRSFIIKENPKLDAKFVNEFVLSLRNRKGFVINLEKAMHWIGYSRKDNAKRALESSFKKDVDYIIELGEIKHNKITEEIMLTVACFKELALQAPTEKGKEVRQYYVAMERSYLDYVDMQLTEYQTQMITMQKQTAEATHRATAAEKEQKKLQEKLLKFVCRESEVVYILDGSMGDVQQENGEVVYKIGYSKNARTREKSYHTGKAHKPAFLLEYRCMNGKVVEDMCKAVLQGYEYEPGREIYEVPFDLLKKVLTMNADYLWTMRQWFEASMRDDKPVELPIVNFSKLCARELEAKIPAQTNIVITGNGNRIWDHLIKQYDEEVVKKENTLSK
jgi:phage anti-repressor protein